MTSKRSCQADDSRRAQGMRTAPWVAHRGQVTRRMRACLPQNLWIITGLLAVLLAGCGKTINHQGTEQLVLSNAVDRAVRSLDFSPLAERKCYLDTSYIKFKSPYFVNAEYITSSLRNQMLGAGCLLVETKTEAEVVVEPRVGSLGSDAHEVTYGIPSSNLVSQAASLVPTAPAIPTIPEIALAKKDYQTGAAKIAVFAYNPKTGRPIWQSGMSVARSDARDTWFFGVGPFQSGTIYEKARFAGNRLKLPLIGNREGVQGGQTVQLDEEFLFTEEEPVPRPSDIATAPAAEEPPAEGVDKGG
jgi:hypothetical protein